MKRRKDKERKKKRKKKKNKKKKRKSNSSRKNDFFSVATLFINSIIFSLIINQSFNEYIFYKTLYK